jgi:hypothetical protein
MCVELRNVCKDVIMAISCREKLRKLVKKRSQGSFIRAETETERLPNTSVKLSQFAIPLGE